MMGKEDVAAPGPAGATRQMEGKDGSLFRPGAVSGASSHRIGIDWSESDRQS